MLQEQYDMFTMVASVLHLGNLTFEEDDNDAAEIHDMAPINVVSVSINYSTGILTWLTVSYI